FRLHPGLLHAAIQLATAETEDAAMPHSVAVAALRAGDATALRVRITRPQERLRLDLLDGAGTPLGTIEGLEGGPAPALESGMPSVGSLFGLEWREVSVPTAGTGGTDI